MAKKKDEKASLFEEMLMWTSYRYAIGRSTYVSSLAYEIPQYYYHKLSPERRQFTSMDVRRVIYDKLCFYPIGLKIERTYDFDSLNPVETLLNFIRKESIKSMDDLASFCKIRYDAHSDRYEYEKKEPTLQSYFSVSDIEELIPWETFASSFDEKNYLAIKGKTYFKSWHRVLIPFEGKSGYYQSAPFGWVPIWYDLDNFLTNGEYSRYFTENDFKKIKQE